ncbi:hypothetical protein AGMMS49975_14570 [Clostridia bacterium]|nr:hypothetical protein AGMMS49975_14570 [Clostridia bacterium]
MENGERQQFNFRPTEKLGNWITKKASEKGVARSTIVLLALDEAMKKDEQPDVNK